MKIWDTLLKKLKTIFQKRLEGKFLPKCYTSLDELPIKIWWDINETGNIALLVKEKNYSLSENEVKILYKNFFTIVNTYSKKYGFSDKFKEIVSKKKELAGHYIKLIVTEDKSEKTFIRILETEIKEIQEEMSLVKGDPYELKAHLDKELGFRIDINICSVTEYMSYIKMLEKKSSLINPAEAA